MNNIGKTVKSLREEAGITQTELSKYVGCSGQVISNVERGYTKPNTELINNLAEYFHVPADYILGLAKSKWAADNPYSTTSKLSSRLNACLMRAGMSVQQLSDLSDIDKILCEDILNNSVKPNIDTLAKIATTLNTTIDYLIGQSTYHTAIATEEEQDIILYFRDMSKTNKRLFLGEMEKLRNAK